MRILLLRFKVAGAKLKGINRQVLITFWQYLLRQDVKHCVLRSMNSLIQCEAGKNCLSGGRNPLCQFEGL
jgi:hypothetical protein